MTYVYPVVSRRAGGVSVGINLNPNNACNWHCLYCQVPELTRGSAPEIDLVLLRRELESMLADILDGDFMQQRVPEECRRLCDIAISGNGEPTSSHQFEAVVALIVEQMQMHRLAIPLRLITNGSYVGKPAVQRALAEMAGQHGEVWIKVDGVSEAAVRRINGVTLDAGRLCEQVKMAAACCPTWIQTCMFSLDGMPPPTEEVDAYIDFVHGLGSEIRGVLLYGLARPSLQPEADRLSPLDAAWMQRLADRLRDLDIEVRLSL